MKHQVRQRKLGRTKDQRRALLRSLAVALIEHERIKTTAAKAKELRPFIEPMITKAARADVHTRRSLAARLNNNKKAVKKLCEQIGPRFADRPGGYTRITKLSPRPSDGAEMAIIEFVE